jgi:hypothetical protein
MVELYGLPSMAEKRFFVTCQLSSIRFNRPKRPTRVERFSLPIVDYSEFRGDEPGELIENRLSGLSGGCLEVLGNSGNRRAHFRPRGAGFQRIKEDGRETEEGLGPGKA